MAKKGRKFGHPVTPVTRAKISASLRGRTYADLGRAPLTDADKAKIKAAVAASPNKAGRPHGYTVTAETRRKISRANKGKRRSLRPEQETRTKHRYLLDHFPKTG